MIILCTQGLGKTYTSKIMEDVFDVDVKDYKNKENWLNEYTDALISLDKDNSFVLGNISEDIMNSLKEKGAEYFLFSPVSSEDAYLTCKALLFGRYILRKDQTPYNLPWINKMKENFDHYCDISFLSKYADKEHLFMMNKTGIIPIFSVDDLIERIKSGEIGGIKND